MNNSDKFSIKKRIHSFRFAFNGIRNLILQEHNARIHMVALACVIGLGIFLKINLLEWSAISIVSGLVILTELLNTAIEKLTDFIEPEWNNKIGQIKDFCAGAVFISAIVSLIVGSLIFIPKIIEIIKHMGN